MKKRDLQHRMYELNDPSWAQRLTLSVMAGLWLALVWWLLFGAGIGTAGKWFGWSWQAGDAVRRACLVAVLSIYFVRMLFTEFVFLKRGVSWSEVFTIAPWLLCIDILLAVTGGTNRRPLGVTGIVGLTLFAAGSWMNSYSEYARRRWKQRPENQGRLYTQGLFTFTRHPNYLGDLLSFSGICFISGAWITALIPVMMLGGFVFVNIPVLDSHLHGKYGASFDEYAKRTRKLIPFVH